MDFFLFSEPNPALSSGTPTPSNSANDQEQDIKKLEFKKQKKILPLVLQNSLTGTGYPANHPDFIGKFRSMHL